MRRLHSPGAGARAALAARGLLLLVAVALAAAPVLILAGSFEQIEWSGDFVTGVILAALLYVSFALGFVVGRWRAALYVWAGSVAVVLVEQALWTPDPARSGIDDLPPASLLPFTPLVMLLPVVGVLLSNAWASNGRSPSSFTR